MAEIVREFVETFILETVMPTVKNLLMTMKFVGLVTVMTLLCKLIGIPAYFSVSGCLLAFLILLVILILERKEYKEVQEFYDELERRGKDEISKLHRNVKLHLDKNSQGGQQESGSDIEDE